MIDRNFYNLHVKSLNSNKIWLIFIIDQFIFRQKSYSNVNCHLNFDILCCVFIITGQ